MGIFEQLESLDFSNKRQHVKKVSSIHCTV